MEEKKLLKLIKDDIAHLEGITGDFSLELPPSSDEVELALVRAKTLLRELELLHKIAAQHEIVSVDPKFSNRLITEIPIQFPSDSEPFELFSTDNLNDDQHKLLLTDHNDQYPDKKTPEDKLKSEDVQNSEGSDEVTIKKEEDEKHFSALVEPIESLDPVPQGPVIVEEEEVGHFTESQEPLVHGENLSEGQNAAEEEEEESHFADSQLGVMHGDYLTVDQNEKDVVNTPISEAAQTDENLSETIAGHKEEAILNQEVHTEESTLAVEADIHTDNRDHPETIVAEEFKEEKKTLNETLGESHQMVNDILTKEQEEIGFQIIQLNSIWDGIGINDRFLFIRELFANSSAKFENTINALDKLSTIQEAVNYLKMNFKWNKTEASHKFLILVKRRFIK